MRCKDIIQYEEVIGERSGSPKRFMNLGQSLGRHSPYLHYLPTIIPNGTLYDANHQRLTFGPELLHVQGMSPSMMPAVKNFRHKLCCDLAGSAFSGAACVAFMLSTLFFVPWPEAVEADTDTLPDNNLDMALEFAGFSLGGLLLITDK